MHWLDVAGPPGVGKSSLCDPLWHPHAFRPDDRLPPYHWHDFLNEVGRLFWLIRRHPSLSAAVRMNRRSVRKMATVARMAGEGPYIQTGLVQRGLGFGWRLEQLGADLNELRHYFRLMPVSIGVAFLTASVETVQARNEERLKHQETAHENRAFMVPLMQPAIAIAEEVLSARGVPVVRIDTGAEPVEAARQALVAFAGRGPCDAATLGPGSEVEVLSPPHWW